MVDLRDRCSDEWVAAQRDRGSQRWRDICDSQYLVSKPAGDRGGEGNVRRRGGAEGGRGKERVEGREGARERGCGEEGDREVTEKEPRSITEAVESMAIDNSQHWLG